jgi:hypothetical protein
VTVAVFSMTVPTGVPTANTTAGAIVNSKANSTFFNSLLPVVTVTLKQATRIRAGRFARLDA